MSTADIVFDLFLAMVFVTVGVLIFRREHDSKERMKRLLPLAVAVILAGLLASEQKVLPLW